MPQTWVEYVFALLDVFVDVVFQKIKLFGVPTLQRIEGHDISGLNCIVTGPTSGIGVETATELARRGANVYLACRSKERGDKMKKMIEEKCLKNGKPPKVEVVLLDVASLKSVRAFIEAWGQHKTPIHCLVNNAGIFNMGTPRSETVDGFEAHLGTNYLGPFLLTMGLLPYIRAAAQQKNNAYGARIVNVSSKLHELGSLHTDDPHLTQPGSYWPLTAYAQSKLAQVTFTAELQERMPGSWRIQVFSLHPGNVMTDVVRDLPSIIQTLYRRIMRITNLTAEEGARSTLQCVVSPDLLVRARRTVGYVDSGGEPSTPNAEAQDEQLQHWLWRFSVESVKLDKDLDLPAIQ